MGWDLWDTAVAFFESATLELVVDCLATGVDVNAQDETRWAAPALLELLDSIQVRLHPAALRGSVQRQPCHHRQHLVEAGARGGCLDLGSLDPPAPRMPSRAPLPSSKFCSTPVQLRPPTIRISLPLGTIARDREELQRLRCLQATGAGSGVSGMEHARVLRVGQPCRGGGLSQGWGGGECPIQHTQSHPTALCGRPQLAAPLVIGALVACRCPGGRPG